MKNNNIIIESETCGNKGFTIKNLCSNYRYIDFYNEIIFNIFNSYKSIVKFKTQKALNIFITTLKKINKKKNKSEKKIYYKIINEHGISFDFIEKCIEEGKPSDEKDIIFEIIFDMSSIERNSKADNIIKENINNMVIVDEGDIFNSNKEVTDIIETNNADKDDNKGVDSDLDISINTLLEDISKIEDANSITKQENIKSIPDIDLIKSNTSSISMNIPVEEKQRCDTLKYQYKNQKELASINIAKSVLENKINIENLNNYIINTCKEYNNSSTDLLEKALKELNKIQSIINISRQ